MKKECRFLSAVLLVVTLLLSSVQMTAAELTALAKRLQQLPDVSQVERVESSQFPEKYVFFITQPLDAQRPCQGTFEQRIILCHRGFDRPTVLVTEGYNADYALRKDYIEELSKLFNTNIVTVEYRYFGKSMPKPCDWQYLTVANSMYDLHHVNQVLHTLYKGKWISTGISKGGQTTMFYRVFFPNDVDISVPYVAPLNRSVEDGRHETFLQSEVSTAANRQKVLDFQMLLFKRKASLLKLFENYCNLKNYSFQIPVKEIYDFNVFEYAFAFWQWGYDVKKIPTATADDDTVFNYWIKICEPDYFSEQTPYLSFNVQAAKELGYYGYYTEPFKKYLSIPTAKGYLHRVMLPDSLQHVKFDPTLYNKTVQFLRTHDPKMVYIYGGIDPWGASGIAGQPWLKGKKNLHVYVCPGGSHATRILSFPEKTKTEIINLITAWLK